MVDGQLVFQRTWRPPEYDDYVSPARKTVKSDVVAGVGLNYLPSTWLSIGVNARIRLVTNDLVRVRTVGVGISVGS